MSRELLVVGIDPGFASLGWARARVSRDSARLESVGVIRTKPAKKRRAVFACDDDVERTRVLYSELEKALEGEPFAICAEAQSWGFRNTKTHRQLGFAWGAIVAASERFGVPIVQVDPAELKRIVADDEKASKQKVAACVSAVAGFDNLPELLSPLAETRREHASDAAAAILACLDSDVVRMVRATL